MRTESERWSKKILLRITRKYWANWLTGICLRLYVGVLDGEEPELRAFSISWSSWSSFIINSTIESSREWSWSSVISYGTENTIDKSEIILVGKNNLKFWKLCFLICHESTLNNKQIFFFLKSTTLCNHFTEYWCTARKIFYTNI